MSKPEKRKISGILLLDKPQGISSNKALQIVKRIFSAEKCGHTGTLDPMATGLLPICFGEATKFSSQLLGADKTYEAILKLGFHSTTGDAEGEISRVAAVVKYPTASTCEQVLEQFIGTIKQTPPMYSALKHRGKPLYHYARNGDVIERQAREIKIYAIRILSLQDDELHLSIRCGTGTYIRVLAQDIGQALGCESAYLTGLRRTAIDLFEINQSIALAALEQIDSAQRHQCLLPVDSLLKNFTPVTLDALATRYIVQGRTIPYLSNSCEKTTTAKTVRLYDEHQQFIGLGEVSSGQQITAKRLLSNTCLAHTLTTDHTSSNE